MKAFYRNSLLIVLVSLLLNCDDMKADLSTKDLNPIDLTTIGYDPISKEEGIYPDTSVLKNPKNPFVKTGITENNKWDIDAGVLSSGATYYLWATILALSPSGENQFYTAEAVRALEGNSSRAQLAYEMVLEHFYHDLTYPGGGVPPVYVSSWACDALNSNFYSEDIMCP